jgi:hypothetical protein
LPDTGGRDLVGRDNSGLGLVEETCGGQAQQRDEEGGKEKHGLSCDEKKEADRRVVEDDRVERCV